MMQARIASASLFLVSLCDLSFDPGELGFDLAEALKQLGLKGPLGQLIASKETPRHQRTTAHLPTNNRPRFVHSPKKRPEERTAADNVPEVP
ncbi:hypothetical protein G7069_08775 [Lysobacter sp. HDW10]|uniref:hypothetical protein n=1 Tax=Lysobacter sp. HDW10 TaxID=2714936 RepID=UPI00140C7148|nr:hypothetical protein [Lysobacter sp. HDW10]QIK81679.1 hypothetical protein G7069_08775 [Lysobacter sp. HDW10]